MSGLHKASILMLALGEEHAGKLFAMMHEDEIRAISATMAQLGVIHADTVETLCGDFVENFGATGGIMGSFESTENLLMKALPKDRVTQIMEEIRGPAGRTMWDKLGNVSEEILASYLKNEYPQTVAVVLSMVKADHSARVLTLLPDSFAMEVVMRMLRMESIQKDVLERVERILRAEFMSNLARASRQDSHQLIAEIFNNFDRKAETRFLAGLEETQPRIGREGEVADVHLRRSDARHAGGPAGAAAPDRQGKAAGRAEGRDRKRSAPCSWRNYRNVPAKMLREDIAALGPVKLKDVEDAQASIANLAKELAASGEIEISTGSDDRMIE